MKKAIVVGCHVSGFGVIRSLALKGFQIVALHYDRYADFAQASRYVHEHAKAPHPGTHEREFVDFLLARRDGWGGALILETNDDAAVALSKNKGKLEKHYRIATPGWDVLRHFIDKARTYELAKKVGVSYPRTRIAHTVEDLTWFKDAYPCILKPVLGHRFASEFGAKLFKIGSFDELQEAFLLCKTTNHEVMIQEIVPGPASNLYNYHVYVNLLGNVSARFLRVKVRQLPPDFGVTRVGVSADRVPEVEEITEKILKAVNFRGFATVEFKIDPRDGEYKLLEVNARLIKSNWLPVYCGVNFPWIMYKDIVEGKQIKAGDYQKNVYWIELVEDAFSTIFRRRGEGTGLYDFLTPYRSPSKTFGDISLADPMPLVKRAANLAKKCCGL